MTQEEIKVNQDECWESAIHGDKRHEESETTQAALWEIALQLCRIADAWTNSYEFQCLACKRLFLKGPREKIECPECPKVNPATALYVGRKRGVNPAPTKSPTPPEP